MQLGLTLTTLPYDSGPDFQSTGNAVQSSGHTDTRSCTRHPQQLAPRHTLGIECQIADGQGEQLNRLLAGYFDRVKQALEMQLPNGPSSDMHAWAAAAAEHGRELYSDDDNSVDIQQQRLVRFQHLAQREIDAGWQPPVVKFHDFLNALASAKNV